ncbi:MAG: SRPBCC domain-containing protein [Rhodothermales bacterium]
METRKHVHEESFAVAPQDVFALLHTPSAIRGWWGADRAIVLPENGGIWAAVWGGTEDDPDYVSVATIESFEPPRRMVLTDYRYHAREGQPPFEADFRVTFSVTASDGGCTLRVEQDGFPAGKEADAFYDACVTGWKETFAGIRKYLARRT